MSYLIMPVTLPGPIYLPDFQSSYALTYLASPFRYLKVLSNVHVQNKTLAPTPVS